MHLLPSCEEPYSSLSDFRVGGLETTGAPFAAHFFPYRAAPSLTTLKGPALAGYYSKSLRPQEQDQEQGQGHGQIPALPDYALLSLLSNDVSSDVCSDVYKTIVLIIVSTADLTMSLSCVKDVT